MVISEDEFEENENKDEENECIIDKIEDLDSSIVIYIGTSNKVINNIMPLHFLLKRNKKIYDEIHEDDKDFFIESKIFSFDLRENKPEICLITRYDIIRLNTFIGLHADFHKNMNNERNGNRFEYFDYLIKRAKLRITSNNLFLHALNKENGVYSYSDLSLRIDLNNDSTNDICNKIIKLVEYNILDKEFTFILK
jgi:hypothetical protein